jgi:hypothetical protein
MAFSLFLPGYFVEQSKRKIPPMNTADWLAYFRQNQLDRRGIAWHEGISLDSRLHGPLARSLARFQLGESSNGTRLLAAARQLSERTGDPFYPRTIALFIAEEQEHSRLLAKVLQQLQAPLLPRHWTDSLFRRGRHLLGFYEEIAVLLMAEIIALKYYGVIRQRCRAPVLEIVCEQILADEKFHVRFHCERLHQVIAPRCWPIRAGCGVGLSMMFAGASAVVAWDHRRAFAALGSSAFEFLRDSWANFFAARKAIFDGTPFARDAADQIPAAASPAPLARVARSVTEPHLTGAPRHFSR